MSYVDLSEKEAIQQEITTLRVCGDILEIQTGEDSITGRIISQPLKEYYELLRRLRVIARKKDNKKRYLSYKNHWGEKVNILRNIIQILIKMPQQQQDKTK